MEGHQELLASEVEVKAHHEGALTPPCIVWKKPQVPHTARQVACHSLNNSWSSYIHLHVAVQSQPSLLKRIIFLHGLILAPLS